MKPHRKAELHLKRARKALAERQYAEAHAACVEALHHDQACSGAYCVMGEMASAHGHLEQAAGFFQKSSQLDPQNLSALIFLARTLSSLQEFTSTLEAANRAVSLKPRDAASLHGLGLVFAHAGDHAQAVDLFQKAVDVAPRNTLYLFDLGVGHQIMGSLEQSEKCFQRCKDVDPGFYKAYAKLVDLRKQTLDKNYLPVLKKLFDHSPEDIERKLTIGYALSKSYEDIEDFRSALEWLQRGKQTIRQRRGYRYDRDQNLFAAAADTFPGPAPKGSPIASQAPIFVVGMPRSGTSLTDRILSSHPEVASAGEMQSIAILMHRLSGVAAPRTLQADAFRRAGSIDMGRLGREYLREAAAITGASRRSIDKLPFNFLFAGVIHRALPNARIICLRRNAVDVCLSNYRTFFSPTSSFHDYSYDLCDTARYYLMFDRLIAHWSAVLPRDRFMSMRYESLVADQEGETRRLLDFCGLEWDPRCLSFHENATGLMTPSVQQVREPMFTTSIGRWRRYGEALRPMIEILQDAGVIDRAATHGPSPGSAEHNLTLL